MRDIKEEIEKLYVELQEETGFKPGDEVKILRKAEGHESGWGNSWVEEMDKFVGKTGKIASITEHGINVEVESNWYSYPYFVLEKAERTYHAGQRFIYNNGAEYILTRICHNKVNLINLDCGNRWSDHCEVKDPQKITEEEMKQLADTFGQWKNFAVKRA